MSRNSLRYNAPGETRTPNLLIRSQFRMEHLPPGTVLREWLAKQEAAKQGPKADTGSHNISHNTSHGVSQLSRVRRGE